MVHLTLQRCCHTWPPEERTHADVRANRQTGLRGFFFLTYNELFLFDFFFFVFVIGRAAPGTTVIGEL